MAERKVRAFVLEGFGEKDVDLTPQANESSAIREAKAHLETVEAVGTFELWKKVATITVTSTNIRKTVVRE